LGKHTEGHVLWPKLVLTHSSRKCHLRSIKNREVPVTTKGIKILKKGEEQGEVNKEKANRFKVDSKETEISRFRGALGGFLANDTLDVCKRSAPKKRGRAEKRKSQRRWAMQLARE